jgi:transposase
MRTEPDAFLKAIAPFREDIVVCVECMFPWYWLADLCSQEHIPFVLGHALYMKAIHGGKTKNDKIDSRKIAGLLRSGMIPQAYVYPATPRQPLALDWMVAPLPTSTNIKVNIRLSCPLTEPVD